MCRIHTISIYYKYIEKKSENLLDLYNLCNLPEQPWATYNKNIKPGIKNKAINRKPNRISKIIIAPETHPHISHSRVLCSIEAHLTLKSNAWGGMFLGISKKTEELGLSESWGISHKGGMVTKKIDPWVSLSGIVSWK